MRQMRCAVALLVLLSICLTTIIAQEGAEQTSPFRAQPRKGKGVVAIKAARLIDGTGRPPILNGVVVVTDDRITAVGPANSLTIPAGAKTIDLGDATLLPGFIDAHTHIIGRVLGDPDNELSAVKDYQSFEAILGVGNAQKTLLAASRAFAMSAQAI